MDVAFVSSNPGKVREVRELLRPFGVRIRAIRRRLPELQADTLTEVVRGKIAAVPPRVGIVLVEDSGLFIDALRGFPGVYSAYVLRTVGLRPLVGLVNSRGAARTAAFRTVAAVRLGRTVRLFHGETRGSIAARPKGTGGFGFDPIFVPGGSRRTYGEMSLDEKNRSSHRARAMRAVGRALAAARRSGVRFSAVAGTKRAARRKAKLH